MTQVQLIPIGDANRPDGEDSIVEIHWEGTGGVRFTIDSGSSVRTSYQWTAPVRFLVLEEGDLVQWFSSHDWAHKSRHGLFEIRPGSLLRWLRDLDGAWLTKTTVATDDHHREWLVCTSNWNALVVASQPPITNTFKQDPGCSSAT